MYLSSVTYENRVLTICRNLEKKIRGIKMHICNPAWMSVVISSRHLLKLQLPTFIRYKRRIDEKNVVSADTVVFSELALIIQKLREIYLENHFKTNIVSYERQFSSMVEAFRGGVDKNHIIKTAIDYITSLVEDLRKKGISIKIASKEELLKRYMENPNKEFESLAHLIDNIKKSYEKQGYIIQLPTYEEQIQMMLQQLSSGESKQSIILKTLNKMEDAKNILARNGVSTDIFPKQESLEQYYIGNDKDYVELAHICDSIRNTYSSHGIPNSILPYQEQLNWIKEKEKNGTSKEQIMRNLITFIGQVKEDFQRRNIPNNLVPTEELYKRYSLIEDPTFVSLATILENIRTFYLTHRLVTNLLPYELNLKVIKEAYQDGISKDIIIETMLNMVEEARVDLDNKGYPNVIPSKEELCRRFNIEQETVKGVVK